MNLLKYSLLRLTLMVAAFYACLFVNVNIIFSIIFAAIIGFAIAYLAFPRLHTAASADLRNLFRRKPGTKKKSLEEENQEIEDAYVEANLQSLPTENQK